MRNSCFIALLIFGQWMAALADFDCICNYKVETEVYKTPAATGDPIGYMYEFDCKPIYGPLQNGFSEIAYEHQIGYVLVGAEVTAQTCQGDIPDADKVTTTPQPTTQETTTPTTTTVAPTTTTTTTPKPTTSTTTSTTTTTATTTTMTTTTTTTTPKSTTTTTTPRPITTTTTTPRPTTTTTTTTPRPTTYTTTMTTRKTTTVPTTLETTATNAVPEGHVELCPPLSKNDIERNHGFLGQYGEFCYEYVPYQTQWKNAERHCNLVSSGHLTYFTREDEQDFVLRLLKSHNHNEDIWIGLTDSDVEGTWTWSSGANVTVRHFQKTFSWKSDHDHLLHDCVVLKSTGEWLDRPCGVQLLLGGGFGESHAYVCQYNLTSKPLSVFNGYLGGFIVG